MTIGFDIDELRPLVAEIVTEVAAGLHQLGDDNRLAFPESEAAGLLGITSTQLRDARLRGEIVATKVGGRIGYEKSELLAYLARGRNE